MDDDKNIVDYRISITSGDFGSDLDDTSYNTIKSMENEEIENIIDQLDHWSYVFKHVLFNKKSKK